MAEIPTPHPVRRLAVSRSRAKRLSIPLAVVLSVVLHLLVVLPFVVMAAHPPRLNVPTKPARVALVLFQQQGAKPSAGARPAAAKPPATKPAHASPKPAPPVPASTKSPAVAAATVPAPPAPGPLGRAIRRPAPARKPAPPAPKPAPQFNLAGSGSAFDAIVHGDNVLPAKPDARYRNDPPVYPLSAARLHQRGTVVVEIRVDANGNPAGVVITQSSGVPALDQAVVTAVEKWHFLPAIRGGRPVPFDLPFRFVFDPK